MRSTKIMYIAKGITNILCPWWINKNCINGQKQSKPFYIHDRSMEIINIDNTHSQKRSKTFYVHDGSTEIIYIGKGITNILCPWWINGNHIYIVQQTFYVHDGKNLLLWPYYIEKKQNILYRKGPKHAMSKMEQRK